MRRSLARREFAILSCPVIPKLDRKPKLTTHLRQMALKRRDSGEDLTEVARTYHVSHSTISPAGRPPHSQ